MSETCVEVKDRVVILVSGGVSSGTAFTGASISGATEKTTPVDADVFPIADSAASNALKKVSWANIKATMKAYLDSFYALLSGGNTFTGAQVINHTATSGTGLQVNIASGGYSGSIFSVRNTSGTPVTLMQLTQAAALSIGGAFTAGGNISASGTVTGSNLSGTNTGDQDISGKANLSGGNTFSGTQIFGSVTMSVGSTFTCGAVNVNLTAPNVWRASLEISTKDQFDAACTNGNFRYVSTYTPSSPAESALIETLPLVDEINYLTPAGSLTSMTWELPASANARVGMVKRLRSSQPVANCNVVLDGGSGTFIGVTGIAIVANTTYEWECVDTSGTGAWLRIA